MKKTTSIKNYWSLNTDEAIVTGILRSNTKKEIEVFMPLNAQMKDIDLILFNTKTKKSTTIQIKGSRAFKGSKKDIKKFGYGSNSWISIKKQTIERSCADYYVFLLHVIEQLDKNEKGKIFIEPHIVIISGKELLEKTRKYKKVSSKGIYQFHLWTKPQESKVFDWRDPKNKGEYGDFSDYLDDKGFEKLNKALL